ncbi:MAG: hypothetical protein IJ189_13625 [Clostridia bacterium]|nr:hypothetical protein [Clostridia bacterium]
MLTKKERDRILRDYPETISKEQFYKLCQISKNRARMLLTSGVVPCQITRRATHKYVIATVDVIAYLDSLPRIRRKRGGAATMPKQARNPALTNVPPDLSDLLRALYDETLEPFPDVMDSRQISDAIGYADTTIIKWCSEGKIRSFIIQKARRIPKPWLIDFLLSPAFLNQSAVSLWHQHAIQPIIDDWLNS